MRTPPFLFQILQAPRSTSIEQKFVPKPTASNHAGSYVVVLTHYNNTLTSFKAVNLLTWAISWLLPHQLPHPWRRKARATTIMLTEKQRKWENTMKYCAEVVSTLVLLHKGHPPAMLHLKGLLFRLCGDH